MTRHAILYDLSRWRRNRLWLLLPAAAFYGFGLLVSVARPQDATAVAWVLMGSILLALASAFWIRQRFCDLRVHGADLVVRIAVVRRLIPLHQVRRARVARLGSILSTPERRRLLPRGGPRVVAQWLDTDALVIRLGDAVDMARLRRAVGRRCLLERDLVVPVVDAQGLLEEIEAARPAPAPAAPASKRRRRHR